jgi:intracellular septation protein
MMHALLLDFLPVLLFFIAFKIYGIYIATVTGIAATFLQVVYNFVIKKKVDKQQVITLFVFVIFGGMTLYFHNPLFIKWKPTVVFWILACVFLGSVFIGKKPIIQRMIEGALEESATTISRKTWVRMNLAWSMFFLSLGSLNVYVAYHYSTETWVNFKLFGVMGIVIAASVLQSLFLMRYIHDKH